MPPLEIVPFADAHLEAAAALLAARHRRQRAAEPLLPERFEEAGAAREELARVWGLDDASGAAAFSGRRMVGYLLGAPRANTVWGDNVWVELAGHAVEEAEVARHLYAAAAGGWVERGRTRHYVLVPASDAGLIHSWFELGFGQQQAHALCEIPEATGATVPAGFEIRAPQPDEIDDLIALDLALPEHHRTAPVFSTVPPQSREASRKEWLETFAGDDEKILIGARNGRPVACWALIDLEREGAALALMRPRAACFLSFAVTLPAERGHGLGVALTNAAFVWAREAGYTAMVTDWRVTNLLASRFWPRRGFRPAFLRLYRHIP